MSSGIQTTCEFLFVDEIMEKESIQDKWKRSKAKPHGMYRVGREMKIQNRAH